MKIFLNHIIFCFIAIALIQVSCKKEYSCENCLERNKPPVANAGRDTSIILPVDSMLIDGRLSSDPDDGISSYEWLKIAGPDTFSIASTSNVTTIVNKLVRAVYAFELTVKDKGGLVAKDTMQLTVYATGTTNRPPVANAGVDTTVVLPVNALMLNGSNSSDPDNNIINYAWSKISGPPAFNISNTSNAQTQVTQLEAGVYRFELKVTDAVGLFATDTIQITVESAVNKDCVFSQTLIGSLSIQRSSVNILEAGNKIVFAGGFVGSAGPPMYGASSRVDIYDRGTQTWSTSELSQNRFAMGTVQLGSKIYFAGGYNGNLCSRVDIYDASTNNWTTAELSEPKQSVIAVAAGDKVLFAGGITSTGSTNSVDIYDQSTDRWSTAALSHPTIGSYPGYYVFAQSGVVVAGSRIYIITGNNNIDIYDAQTNTWSKLVLSGNQLTQGRVVMFDNKIYFSGSTPGTARPDYGYANTLEKYDILTGSWSSIQMVQARAMMAAIAGDGKIFWAGGFDSSWNVNGEEALRPVLSIEMYEVNTGIHSFHNLRQPVWWVKALKTNNKIFFSYGSYNETYDMNSHSWTTCNIFLNQALAIGNTVYQVGADDSSVWRLEF